VNQLSARANRGVKLLILRRAAMQMITFGGGVILARILTPAEFGLFGIATILVQMFELVGDVGLSPFFIQRRADVTERDLQIGFTLQQILTTVIVAVLLLAAPYLVALYPKAPPETVWLVRALAVNLYLVSWRAMSVLQMERQLRYERLAPAEVFETLVYQGAAVILALMGFGIWSFAVATLLRGLVGSLVMYAMAPWRVRFGFDRATAGDVLRFGIPFQITTAINRANGWVPALIGGMLVGPSAVGLLNWAWQNTRPPSVLLESIARVSFSHFSRLQDDMAELERSIVYYLGVALLGSSFFAAMVLVAGPTAANWIFTTKWASAIPALLIYSVGVSIDAVIITLTNAQNAIGKVNLATQRAVARCAINFVVSSLLVLVIGFNGIPIGFAIAMLCTAPLAFHGLQPGAMRRVLGGIVWLLPPFALSTLLGRAILLLPFPLVIGTPLAGLVCAVTYGVAAYLCGPDWLRSKYRRIAASCASLLGRRTATPV
jgi:PST family polysaccharide transporter